LAGRRPGRGSRGLPPAFDGRTARGSRPGRPRWPL